MRSLITRTWFHQHEGKRVSIATTVDHNTETSTAMNYKTAMCACAALMCIAPAWGQDEEEAATAAKGRRSEIAPQEATGAQQGPASQRAGGLQSGGSSVTIYGLIDQGVEYVNNIAKGSTTADTVRVSHGTATSYFGIRGTEDLGGGLQALWDLQGGYAPDNGTSLQGGRLFGRQSYVGLSGKYGRLTFGRQYTMRFYATSPINPFGTGAHGLTTLDNGIANARADNSIAYRYHAGGLELGVNYSFGRDAVDGKSQVASNCPGETGSGSQCRAFGAMVKYETSNWGVTTAYDRLNGGTSATFGGLTSPDRTDTRYILGGYFFVSGARIGGGWIRRINDGLSTPRSNLFWVSAKVPVTANFSIDGMVAHIKYDQSPDKALTFVLRGMYSLSKRTALYVTADHISNGGALAYSATNSSPSVPPQPGGKQLSVIAGVKHVF